MKTNYTDDGNNNRKKAKEAKEKTDKGRTRRA